MTLVIIGYKLECGHTVSGPASLVSGTLECPWHLQRSQIADIVTEEWRAKCRNCTYGRWAGQSENTAHIFAAGHKRRNSGHVVNVFYAVNPDAQKTKDKFDSWRVRAKS